MTGEVKRLQVLGLPTSIDPDKVVFPDGLNTTYAIGKVTLTNGMGTLVEPGGTLTDFFNVFVDEKNPTTTQPSVTVTLSQAKAYEVGTYVTPSYTATFDPGKYTYGPDTGVSLTSWEVTDTNGNTAATDSGSFEQFQVTDDIEYNITAVANYGDGTIPVTNVGNEYAAGQIKTGSKSNITKSVTGYRNTFYGTLTEKVDITSDVIRNLKSKSNKALSDGSSFDINIPVGAIRIVFAYPATLREDGRSSVKDVNGMSAEIGSGFNIQTIAVEGDNEYASIDYKVYVLDYAEPNDTVNTYTVTI